MVDPSAQAVSNAQEYAQRRRLQLKELLGFGQDGIVFSTDVATAVKSFKYKELYRKELAVYRRFAERNVEGPLCGFNLPKMLGHHDELTVIEMEFVTAPFVVDFASAEIDKNPLDKYDPEQRAEQLAAWREIFGENWPAVRQLLYELRSHGVYLADLNTNNIVFSPPSTA